MRRTVTQVLSKTITPEHNTRPDRITRLSQEHSHLQPGDPPGLARSSRMLPWSTGGGTRISPAGNTRRWLQQSQFSFFPSTGESSHPGRRRWWGCPSWACSTVSDQRTSREHDGNTERERTQVFRQRGERGEHRPQHGGQSESDPSLSLSPSILQPHVRIKLAN